MKRMQGAKIKRNRMEETEMKHVWKVNDYLIIKLNGHHWPNVLYFCLLLRLSFTKKLNSHLKKRYNEVCIILVYDSFVSLEGSKATTEGLK